MAMDSELKAEWLKALRGKKYKQTTGKLEDVSNGEIKGNCCLGVLCRVAKVETEVAHGCTIFAGQDDKLNKTYLRKFGITEKQQTHLINMNDGDDGSNTDDGLEMDLHSFKEIADWIDKNIKVKKVA